MTLLDITKRLTRDEEGRHFNFPFEVQMPAKELIVKMSFTPDIYEDREKSVEIIREGLLKYTGIFDEEKINNYLPLKNLLTVSVDSPHKCLGTAHRHQKEQQHYINKRKASRGFVPSEIMAGSWNITLSAHAIISEFIDVTLTAEAVYD